MTVGLHIGGVTTEVGSASFLAAFFMTIHYHLEREIWGERFPVVLCELYEGQVLEANAEIALVELREIADELAEIAPSEVVWDLENLQAEPPWGSNISEEITDLSNYFVTSTGRDLLASIRESLESSVSHGGDVTVVSY